VPTAARISISAQTRYIRVAFWTQYFLSTSNNKAPNMSIISHLFGSTGSRFEAVRISAATGALRTVGDNDQKLAQEDGGNLATLATAAANSLAQEGGNLASLAAATNSYDSDTNIEDTDFNNIDATRILLVGGEIETQNKVVPIQLDSGGRVKTERRALDSDFLWDGLTETISADENNEATSPEKLLGATRGLTVYFETDTDGDLILEFECRGGWYPDGNIYSFAANEKRAIHYSPIVTSGVRGRFKFTGTAALTLKVQYIPE
jgi:hypothetical protein